MHDVSCSVREGHDRVATAWMCCGTSGLLDDVSLPIVYIVLFEIERLLLSFVQWMAACTCGRVLWMDAHVEEHTALAATHNALFLDPGPALHTPVDVPRSSHAASHYLFVNHAPEQLKSG